MMTGKQTATMFILCVGLVGGLLVGCGGSSPQVQTAETALKAGDYQDALSKIETALEKDSADTDAYLMRARVFRLMADSTNPEEYKRLHSQAREAEEKALSFDKDLREEVHTRRKRIFDREIDRGRLAYNRAKKYDKPDRYRQAIAYYGAAGIAQADSARPVLNEAYARLRVGQRKKVLPVLETYVERADTVASRAYKILGQLYMSHGQSDKAIRLLEDGIQQYPSDQALQGLRLNAYNRAGRVYEAMTAYRDRVEGDPENALYRYNYGTLLLEAERYSEAIAQLERAVEIDPDHVGSQYNLGAAYVNAALARDDSIAVIERGEATRDSAAVDSSTAGSDMSTDTFGTPQADVDSTQREKRIQKLAQKREDFFKKAIPPLERVRRMDDTPRKVRRDACRALMVAYVQTNRPGRAARVEQCTGLAEADL